MVTHTLEIKGWQPATLNSLLSGRTWHKAARLKKHDRELVTVLARNHRIPQATTRRRVSLVVTMAKGQRRPDEDAYWKSLLDALVAAKLLVDDSPKWCKLGGVVFLRGKDEAIGTQIVLDDLPAERSIEREEKGEAV